MRKYLIKACLLLGLLTQAEFMFGSAFKVTPVRVTLVPGSASTLLTLTNESDQTLRFQISAFGWSQAADGTMNLTPTEDILFFPALLSLNAGEERKVRIASKTPAAETEKSYRIFFEELPPLASQASAEGAQVRILTKMGVPVFVAPAKVSESGQIDAIRVENGKLHFAVKNSGNVHFSVQGVRVRGLGESGSDVFERQLDGWYVLPGTPRTYEVELPTDVCGKIRSVSIEAQTDMAPNGSSVTGSAAVPPRSCKSSS
ncbi:MAG TPA: fimbria/pilus periplasmic chaperone [Thermoanaerobaculia bacterium]|nr:fimbria/pilus periplasmic chaperone [Thermoanaerobaculia bacterium]